MDDSGEDYLYPPDNFKVIYRENDNPNYVMIERYRKLPIEELERLIREKEAEILGGL